MPYDKVVDSAVLESGLTSIANAIREKAGTSDALAFPAGFLEAIAAIESGGGGFYYEELTFAEDVSNSRLVTHNLGIIPNFVFCVSDADVSASGYYVSAYMVYMEDVDTPKTGWSNMLRKISPSGSSWTQQNNYKNSSVNGGKALTDTGMSSGSIATKATDTSIEIRPYSSDYGGFLHQAGATYKTIIGRIGT